jgi:hypothetical protein
VSKHTKKKEGRGNLDDDRRPGREISPKMRGLLEKERAQARKRIIETGIVHFRADPEFMELLMEVADTLKIAPGTLCRQIVWERLQYLRIWRSSIMTDATGVLTNSSTFVERLVALQETAAALCDDIREHVDPTGVSADAVNAGLNRRRSKPTFKGGASGGGRSKGSTRKR